MLTYLLVFNHQFEHKNIPLLLSYGIRAKVFCVSPNYSSFTAVLQIELLLFHWMWFCPFLEVFFCDHWQRSGVLYSLNYIIIRGSSGNMDQWIVDSGSWIEGIDQMHILAFCAGKPLYKLRDNFIV